MDNNPIEINDITDKRVVRKGPYATVYRVPAQIKVQTHYPTVEYCKYGKKYNYVMVKE